MPAKPTPEEQVAKVISDLRERLEFITQAELADLVKVSRERISKMTSDGIIPQDDRGRYRRDDTIKAAFAWMRERLGDSKSEMGASKKSKLDLEVQLLETTLAKAQGKVMDIDAVGKAWAEIVLTTRQKLVHLAAKIAPRIPFCKTEAEVQEAIHSEVCDALTELSRAPQYDAPAIAEGA